MKKQRKFASQRMFALLLTLVMVLQLLPALPLASAVQGDSTFQGFTGWTISGGVWEPGTGISGNGAKIIPNGEQGVQIQSQAVSVMPGEQLRAGISVQIPADGLASLYLLTYSDAAGKVSAGEPVLLDTQSSNGAFAELAADYTVNKGIYAVRLQLSVGDSGTYIADNAFLRGYTDLPEFTGVMGDGYGVKGQWSLFYPLTYADGDWALQKNEVQDPKGFNYAQIVEEGKADKGAIRFLRGDVYEHIGVAIGADLTLGEEYTLKMWVKGNASQAYGGLQVYGQGDPQLATFGANGSCSNPNQWYELTQKFTATRYHLYLFMNGGAYACDVLMDNVRILDKNGKDMLEGMGNLTGDGTVNLGKNNRIVNGEFEDTLYSYLPLDSFNGTFQNAQVSEEGMEWVLNTESTDELNVLIDDDGKHLQLIKTGADSMLQGPAIAVEAGQTYQIVMDMKTTGTAVLGGVYLDEEGNEADYWLSESSCENEQWTNVSAYAAVPVGAVSLKLRIAFSGEYGDTLEFDNIKVHPCQVAGTEPEMTEPEVTEPETNFVPAGLDTAQKCNAYGGSAEDYWMPMYPTGNPDSGTWGAWDSLHNGTLATEGKNDVGSLCLKSIPGKNTGVAINAGMTVGQTYTLSLWAKGTSNSGRVLSMYGNGDQIIIAESLKLTADWSQYTVTLRATMSQLNILAADWGNTTIYLDNITLTDTQGNDLLAGKGDFCKEKTETEEPPAEDAANLIMNPEALDASQMCNAYDGSADDYWMPMYPTGAPQTGTWEAWNTQHYGEIAAAGKNDPGSLRLVSIPTKNTGVAINAGMIPGQKYVLGLWAKGTSNSGRVLAMYANGDPIIIGASSLLSSDWKYYEIAFVAGMSQLNILAADWGNTDIYLDNITLKDKAGNNILAGRGDFCMENLNPPETTEPEETEPEITEPVFLDTVNCASHGSCTSPYWATFYPTGTPTGGTWEAWNSASHFGEVANEGYKDAGALHLKSNIGKNTAVSIHAGMIPGQTYTLGMWVKGTSNSGRVLGMYGNGDAVIIGPSEDLAAQWKYYELTFTANLPQLNLICTDWGISDLYIDNITLKDSSGKDVLLYRGDFCLRIPGQPHADQSVNLYEAGNFESLANLTIPGWIVDGTASKDGDTVTLRKGANIQSLRYNIEVGQILKVQWTGRDGILTAQIGNHDKILKTAEIGADGLMFSVPDGTEWIRVIYTAADKPADISLVEILDMGDPANLDFELKDPAGQLPLNWSTWTAVNDTSLSPSIADGAYTVEQQESAGVDGSNALHITLNKNIPQNESANNVTAVVDSIKVQVQPNTTYRFSYYVKMDAQNGSIYPSVKCYTEDGSLDGPTQWLSGAVASESFDQWKQYRTTFSTGADTTSITFRLEAKASNAGAQFWIDRLEYAYLGSSLDLNLNFELGDVGEIPLNWTVYERDYQTNAEGAFGNYTASRQLGVSVDGSSALKVQKSNSATTEMYVCSGMIKVNPNSAYYFSYDAATLKAEAGDQILIMLRQKKANGDNVSDEAKAFYWPTNAYATGHFNWSEFGAIFDTAPDCEYIQVMFCFRGSSGYTAYVDNVSLMPTNKIEDMNLDFEYSVGKIPLNWSFNGVLANSSMSVSTENVYSGNQALRVLREDGELDCSFVFSNKTIPVKAGDKIEVVFNHTSRNAVSGQFSACLFGYADSTNLDWNRDIVNAMYGQERVTNAGSDWSQWDTYELVYTVPKGVNYIQLVIRVGGTFNDMLFDDITVYNYTQNDNMIYAENFKSPSVTTGLPGGWVVESGDAKVNGQLSLSGDNAEVSTKLYTLKTDYVYTLTANIFTTGSAKGQLIMEAVNWDGTVAGQPVVLELSTLGTNQELKATFESLSAVYYRLIVRKTEGEGDVCVEKITLHQTGEPYKGITWAGKWLTHPDETARLSNSPHPFTERHYYTRTEINLDKPIETAQMQITADDKFDLYINGMQVYEETRTGDTWDLPVTVDIAQYLQQGKNVIAIDMFNNIYLYGLLFDGIVKMEDESTLRFYSTSDTMMAAECLSNEMVPTRNPLWTEEDQRSWMTEDYDVSTCPLWVHADEYASIGGGGWGDISFDPTEYSDYKIFSNEFTFPEEEVTAGEIIKVSAQVTLEKELPETNSFRVDIWKKNTTSRICSAVLTVADGKSTADWPVGEEFTAEFELQIPQFLAEGAYTVQFESTVSVVSDYFINNKVGSIKVAQSPLELTTTSSVEVIDGKTQMVVNGEVVAPMWYARPERPSQFEEHIVTEFGKVGVDTIVSYIFLNNIYGDVWTKEGFVPDLVDSMMLDTLAGNPDAKLIVALDFNAPQWWCEENPGEMAALSTETVTRTNASFASQKWKEESGAIMVDAIHHMMSQPYANNIIGFKVTGGYTLEWNWWASSGIYTDVGDFSQCGIEAFRAWLTEKYGTDAALQKAWNDATVTLADVMPPSKESRADDYWKTVASIQDMPDFVDYEMYMAELKVDTIDYFAKLTKDAVDNRLLVGTYAGYFYMGGGYEFSSAVANSYYQDVLNSEYLDFVKTPWMYGMRETGDSSQFMGPVDSVYAHDKLWIVEEDSRMNRKEMAEGQDGRSAVGWTRDYQQSVENLKRNFSYILSKGMGVSFYNLMWDFFDDAQYYGAIGQMHQEMTLSLGLNSHSVADIAVFVDGDSQMLIPWEKDYLNGTLYQSIYVEQLEELGHVGASYDMYLMDDLVDGLVPEHKINIFMGTTWMDAEERKAIEEKLQKNGNILVWIFTSGIADGEKTDISLLEDVTGMDLSVISTKRKQIATAKIADSAHWLTEGLNVGRPYGVKSYDKMAPVIAVTDHSAKALAYHSTTSTSDNTPAGQVALAVKNMGDWTSIYSAVPNIPQAMIRNMLKQVKGHNYTASGSDVIYANENYVALHSNFAGQREIKLPGNYTVYDVFNRQIISTNADSFKVTLSGKETRLFRLSAPNTAYVYIAKDAGGSVSHPGLTTVRPGDSMTFTVEADPGYRLNYLMIDGIKTTIEGNSYTFTDIQESHTVIAHFSRTYGTAEDTLEQPDDTVDQEHNEKLMPVILVCGGITLLLIALAIILLMIRKKKAS